MFFSTVQKDEIRSSNKAIQGFHDCRSYARGALLLKYANYEQTANLKSTYYRTFHGVSK